MELVATTMLLNTTKRLGYPIAVKFGTISADLEGAGVDGDLTIVILNMKKPTSLSFYLIMQGWQLRQLAEGAERKEQLAACTAEKKQISPYASSIIQIDNCVVVPLSGWKRTKCDKTDNLWLNLTDGMILCGRKNWDGTGGNNHAVEHYKEIGYPIAGTISADLEGAGVRYPSPYPAMVRPAFPPHPPGVIGVFPVLPRPPVPGIQGILPVIPVRPALLPVVTPAEKSQTTIYVGKIALTVEDDFMLSQLWLCGPIKD